MKPDFPSQRGPRLGASSAPVWLGGDRSELVGGPSGHGAKPPNDAALEKLRTPCGEVRQDWTRQPTSTGGKDSERRVGCSPSNLVQERHRALEGAA